MKDFKLVWNEIPTSWKWSFFICMAVSLALLITGFILPPPGAVDDSVFKACFIIMAYPTLFTVFICVLRGLSVHYDIKEGEITINSKHDETTSEENNKS